MLWQSSKAFSFGMSNLKNSATFLSKNIKPAQTGHKNLLK